MRTIPARQSADGPAVKSPGPTKVAGFATMTPPFLRPMNAMKSPTPQVTASFRPSGIDAMIFSRTPVTDSDRKMSPLMKTIPSASLHGSPFPRQIVNVKNALIPMPGARAIGKLVKSAMSVVATAAVIAVTVTRAALVHPRVRQDGGVDREDVGHRGERRQARLKLAERRRSAAFELEEA